MSTPLTPEQKKRIEENRRLALKRRNEKLQQKTSVIQSPNPVKNFPAQQPHSKPLVGPSANTSAGTAFPINSSVIQSSNPVKNFPAQQPYPKPVVGPSANTSAGTAFPVNKTQNTIQKNQFYSSSSASPVKSFAGQQSYSKPPSVNSNVNLPSDKVPIQKPNTQLNDRQKTWNVTTEALTGTCSLISRNRFILNIGYNKELIEICKTIPGKEYDPKRKAWTFPLEQYNKFKEVTTPLSPKVIIGNLPKAVLQNFMEPSKRDHKSVDISKVEATLLNSLFPFQKEGVQFGVSMNGRCLIADDMGLGKTLQGLGLASYYINDWPLLIVCPSSMRYQWQEELLNYLPQVPSYSIYVLEHRKDYIEKSAKVVILSYDLMGKLKDFIMKHGFGVIIIDESHFLKNNKTQRTKAALDIVKKCKRCILLSGTPALSRPSELFCQIKAVNPNLFRDMTEYGLRYCDGKQDKFGWNFNGSSNLEELKVILDELIMIRRLKSEVLDQLPSKIRQVITLSPDLIDTKNKTMKAFEKKLAAMGDKGIDRRSTLLAYFAETGKIKIKAICQHVENLLEQGKKFLLFAHHKEVLDAVSQTLEKAETYYIRIDGSVSSEDRKSVCDQFQEEDKFRVAVLSIKAANTGVTLTAAHLVVFAELFWNPGELIQAEDRAHRIGQKNSVLIHYLLAKGTADDQLWPLVQSKLNVLNKAGLSNDREISVKEIKSQKGLSQTTIMNFFSQMEDDVDENDLASLMDEIEGVPEKKTKLM